MKIKHIALMGVALLAASAFMSCTQEPMMKIPAEEAYARAFIRQFGLIDPAQDWNLAQEGSVTVDVGSHADVVKIYANVSNDFYLVADLRDVSGKFDVPIDIPETTTRLKVNIDGMIKYISVGESVSRAEMASRAEGDVVTVSDDHSAATQWIISGQDALKFLEDVPEMQYNRRKETIKTDFLLVGTGEPMVVYPLFWNTSHTHTLGIYYFNTNDTDEEGYSTIQYVPFYTTKEKGDDAHLKIHEFTSNDIDTYTLGWEQGGNATYNLGWLNGTQTYTLGWQAGTGGDYYELRFNWDTKEVYNETWENQSPDWMKEAAAEYIASTTYTSSESLLTDARFASAICQAATTNLEGQYTLTEITNYNTPTFIRFKLAPAGGPTNDQGAPTNLYNAVIDYMTTNNIATYSGISATDQDFVDAIEAIIGTSDFSWSINGNNANISYSVNGPANGSSNPAPVDLFTYIAKQITGTNDYDSLTGDDFTSTLDDKIKEILGANYSLTSWIPNGQSATINVTYSGKPSNTSHIDTDVFNYVYSFFEAGDSYTTLGNKTNFLSGLKTLLETKHGNGVKVQWYPNNGWAQIKVSSITYDTDWVYANATKSETGTRINRDGTTTGEVLQNKDQTAYDYDYEGEIMSQGITVTVQKGKRFGFYIKYGGNNQIRYTELKGNIEWYERVSGQPAPTEGSRYNTPQSEMFIYAAMYKKQFPGTVGNGSQNNIQYLLFEDWDDTGEESDADLNDLAIAITGLDIDNPEHFIDHSSTRESEDKELTWLIAAEDLGTTDDFDFNDVVFTMSCVTKKVKDTNTTTTDGQVTSSTSTTTFTKEVKIQALAAGGTLPVWLHYNNGTIDYILGPNKVVVNNGAVSQEDQDACEWHQWFGKASSDMVNTGRGSTVAKPACLQIGYTKSTTPVAADDDSSTWLIDAFSGDFSMAQYSQTLKNGTVEGFYITVGTITGEEMQGLGGTTTSDITKNPHVIGVAKTGAAPQMFIIPDVGYNNGKWHWPSERYHILECYPGFGDWVNDANQKDWHKAEPAASVFRVNP